MRSHGNRPPTESWAVCSGSGVNPFTGWRKSPATMPIMAGSVAVRRISLQGNGDASGGVLASRGKGDAHLRRDQDRAPGPQKRARRLPSWVLNAAPWVALAATAAALVYRPSSKPQPGMSVQQALSPEEFDRDEPGRGRLASAPHKIPPKGWKDILWRTYQEVTHDRLSAVAGSVTFYTLMAIFPALGVFASLYGLFSDVEQARQQLADLAAVFPRSVLDLVGDQMVRMASRRPVSLSAAFVIFLLVSVWSANAG